MGKQWSDRPRKIRVSDISYSHSPDKRGERTDRWGREPILVKRSWGGWRVHDGNDRLHYARERGDTHIEAYVEEDVSGEPVKRRGFFYWA